MSGLRKSISVPGVGVDQFTSDVGVKLLVQRSHLAPQLLDHLLEVIGLERRPPVNAVVRVAWIREKTNINAIINNQSDRFSTILAEVIVLLTEYHRQSM